MTKKTSGAKRVADNVESIQEGFQKVLADHGVHNLRVSNFRLTEVKHEESVAAASTANSQGCWKWVCEMTPAGQVCHKVWDPNC
jgi:hypothetical protein